MDESPAYLARNGAPWGRAKHALPAARRRPNATGPGRSVWDAAPAASIVYTLRMPGGSPGRRGPAFRVSRPPSQRCWSARRLRELSLLRYSPNTARRMGMRAWTWTMILPVLPRLGIGMSCISISRTTALTFSPRPQLLPARYRPRPHRYRGRASMTCLPVSYSLRPPQVLSAPGNMPGMSRACRRRTTMWR